MLDKIFEWLLNILFLMLIIIAIIVGIGTIIVLIKSGGIL